MTIVANDTSMIIRTARGLSIAGTRLTLYDIMDFYTAGYPREAIRDRLGLSEVQINAALAYIETYYAEVTTEYAEVLTKAEHNQRYWETRLRDHLAKTSLEQLSPKQRDLHQKFQRWKATREVAPCSS